MSSKAKKMAEQVKAPEQKTITARYRIDVDLENIGTKSVYITVSGIPEGLPADYENTITRAAESQFVKTLNERMFIEFYNEGKTSNDEQPIFYNLSKLASLQIKSVTKVQ